MKKRILLVSYSPSHVRHNSRVEKVLEKSFAISHHSFVINGSTKKPFLPFRQSMSNIANYLSTFFISLLVIAPRGIPSKFRKPESNQRLLSFIEDYFQGSRTFVSKILNSNRTLRRQIYQINISKSVANLAREVGAICILLPEDNNYYASGMTINFAKKAGLKIGILNFSTGMETEFIESRHFLVPDMKLNRYDLFSRLFLTSTTVSHWSIMRKFINSFPGSLETTQFRNLGPSFSSGDADFYLTSHVSEIRHLKEIASSSAVIELIEPTEVSLLKNQSKLQENRETFGVFLPPNQLGDPKVRKRVSKSLPKSYKDIILQIIDAAKSARLETEDFVIFPHPRMYESEPEVLALLAKDYKLADDFALFLGTMKCALIFSSAVFTSLLASDVRIFNFDLYQYGYDQVFPTDNPNFITITDLEELKQIPHSISYKPQEELASRSTVSQFLELYL